MTERAATHGESIMFFPGSSGQGYWQPGQMMEAATALHGMYPGSFLGSSGIPTTITPSLEKRMNALDQKIDAQTQEILQLQQLVYDMARQLQQSLQGVEPEETSEILDLQPLSRMHVNAQVGQYYEPARLHIIEEAEDTDSEDTEE